MSKTNIGSYLTSFDGWSSDGPAMVYSYMKKFFEKLVAHKLWPCVKVTDSSLRLVDFMLNYSCNNP